MSLEISMMEMAKEVHFLAIQVEHLTNALKGSTAPAVVSESQDQSEPEKTSKSTKQTKPVKEKDKPKADEPAPKKEADKKPASEEDLRAALTAMQKFYAEVAKTPKEKDAAKDRARLVMFKFGGASKISEIKPENYGELITEAKRIVAKKDNSIVEPPTKADEDDE